MNVKLIKRGDQYTYAPADSENQPTLILCIGVASKRSIMKMIKKNGHTITQQVDRTGEPLGKVA